MQRSVVVGAVVAALCVSLILLAAPWVVSATPPCTDVGTKGRDQLIGDGNRDVLCAKGGQDYVHGKGGPDEARGGDGSDTLVGGEGWDQLRGLDGPDEIFAVDGLATEVIDGGRGEDRCYGDVGDQFDNCEHVVKVADA